MHQAINGMICQDRVLNFDGNEYTASTYESAVPSIEPGNDKIISGVINIDEVLHVIPDQYFYFWLYDSGGDPPFFNIGWDVALYSGNALLDCFGFLDIISYSYLIGPSWLQLQQPSTWPYMDSGLGVKYSNITGNYSASLLWQHPYTGAASTIALPQVPLP
jgi:hypothetical protein